MARFGLDLVPVGTYFTFADLENVPRYTIAGGELLTVPATKTFEGEPWEVFEENEIVYDFNRGLLVPITSVTQLITVKKAGNRFVSSGLILPGSVTEDGDRVKDYSAWYSRDTLRFLYSEVTFV